MKAGHDQDLNRNLRMRLNCVVHDFNGLTEPNKSLDITIERSRTGLASYTKQDNRVQWRSENQTHKLWKLLNYRPNYNG